MKEVVKNIITNNELMILVFGCMVAPFITSVVDKFTQRFYPTSKSIQDIREVQLKEVYLPLHRKFRKYIGLPAKKLQMSEYRELYAKAYVKVKKYPVYLEEDIIDCIEALGRDIKKYDEDPAREQYKRTAVKLLRNIKIQYLSLKNSLSYTTNTSFRSFRSLDKAEQFYRASSILYFLALAGMAVGMVLMQAAEPNYIVFLLSFLLLCVSGVIMIVSALIDIIKVLFWWLARRG